jgi:hypothetical protein
VFLSRHVAGSNFSLNSCRTAYVGFFSISLLISFHWSFQASGSYNFLPTSFRVAKLFFRFNSLVNQRKYVKYNHKGAGAREALYQVSPPDMFFVGLISKLAPCILVSYFENDFTLSCKFIPLLEHFLKFSIFS